MQDIYATASYLPSLQLRRLAVKNVAGLDALGKHPYRPIEHALNMTGYLGDRRKARPDTRAHPARRRAWLSVRGNMMQLQ